MPPGSKSLETWKRIGPLQIYQIFENSVEDMKINDKVDKIKETVIG
jgi:hypothetical protein